MVVIFFQNCHPFVHGHVLLDEEGSCAVQRHHHLWHWIWIHPGVSGCKSGLSKVFTCTFGLQYIMYFNFLCLVYRECFLPSRVGDRPVLLVGLAIIFCGFFILLPWGNHYPKIQWAGMDCFNCTGYLYYPALRLNNSVVLSALCHWNKSSIVWNIINCILFCSF